MKTIKIGHRILSATFLGLLFFSLSSFSIGQTPAVPDHKAGERMLVEAAKKGDVDTVKTLLANGVNPAVKDPNTGCIPLIFAALNLAEANKTGVSSNRLWRC